MNRVRRKGGRGLASFGGFPERYARSSVRRKPGRLNFGILTSARGRDILIFVRGRVDRESAPGDIRSSAKRKFLSFEGGLLSIRVSFHINNHDGDATAILDSLKKLAG
jgi:hypothetical protein